MKPVVIFRHSPSEGPGHFATFLRGRDVPWQLVAIDAGEPVPADVHAFSGLVFMGGPMSVNDELPWIPLALALIRRAVAVDIPVLGHCLGGQLMAKALGGTVGPNLVKEIGWGPVTAADNDAARAWFGETRSFDAFHWHGETFTLPQGATNVLSSPYCASQAFALGKHLGMQCHVEMTAEMVRDWYALGAEEVAAASASPSVQRVEQATGEGLEGKVRALNAVAERVYSRWVAGLVG